MAKKGFPNVALVLGILAIALFWVPFLDIILAVLAIIFGSLSLHGEHKGRGIAGLILGIITIALVILFIALAVGLISSMM